MGEFDIDLISIYFANDRHAIENQWVGLNNLQQSEDINGYLKFSCAFTGPKDKQIELCEEKKTSDNNTKQLFSFGSLYENNKNDIGILLPPSIKTTGWQIEINLIKGECLPKMDLNGTIDPYIIFEFGAAKYKTNPIKNNQNPTWNLKINVKLNIIL